MEGLDVQLKCSFIQQIFIEHLLCVSHHARYNRNTRWNQTRPYTRGSAEMRRIIYNPTNMNRMPFVRQTPEKYLKAWLLIVLTQLRR